MIVEELSQVGDDPIADIAHEIPLAPGAKRFHQEDQEHHQRQDLEHGHLLLDEDFIQHRLDEIGRSGGAGRDSEHAQHGRRQPPPVGRNQLDQALDDGQG